MIEAHWGLTGKPFQLTPDPRFWFETATHRKAMAYLGYGLAQQEGFIVITGDIGAGKTTLIGHLLATIDRTPLHVVQIMSAAIDAADLLRIVAAQLGVDIAGMDKAQLLGAIERGLHAVARSGKRTLLVVDEAQALPVAALEELRMLSNFQAGGHALLQIVLLGQPEFRDRLNGTDSLDQLRQRIIAIHHLDPMEEDEVADYIAHRLSLVSWRGRPDFAEDSFTALYEATGGVPRRLNLLAARVLLQAAVTGQDLIDGDVVRAVQADLAADLPGSAETSSSSPRDADALGPFPTGRGEGTRRESLGRGEAAQGSSDAQHRWNGGEGEGKFNNTAARIADLERRLQQQDDALRRVLTLLVDWVEADPANAPRLHAA